MDISNATIEFVGKVEIDSRNNKKKLVIDVSTASMPKTRYLIWQNNIQNFDIVRKFEWGDYKVGDQIDFDFNVATGNHFPTIWRIRNHKRKEA